jgi:nucleoside-diphosphate-sugar epimerase
VLAALQSFEVEQLVYSGTMLVHEPCAPGERIDESRPIAPKWAYPKSKAAAEDVIRSEHGRIPYVLLHLAGMYDEKKCVPTLANQIARIYQRDFKSYLYAGDPHAGQSLVHKEDMIDAFRRTVERRRELPPDAVILVGEPEAMGYDELQDEIGRLIHGEPEWTTLRLPKPAAKIGAALQEKLEPLIPDVIDKGEKPFVRPFMIAMADDHYALDITKARRLLGWNRDTASAPCCRRSCRRSKPIRKAGTKQTASRRPTGSRPPKRRTSVRKRCARGTRPRCAKPITATCGRTFAISPLAPGWSRGRRSSACNRPRLLQATSCRVPP